VSQNIKESGKPFSAVSQGVSVTYYCQCTEGIKLNSVIVGTYGFAEIIESWHKELIHII